MLRQPLVLPPWLFLHHAPLLGKSGQAPELVSQGDGRAPRGSNVFDWHLLEHIPPMETRGLVAPAAASLGLEIPLDSIIDVQGTFGSVADSATFRRRLRRVGFALALATIAGRQKTYEHGGPATGKEVIFTFLTFRDEHEVRSVGRLMAGFRFKV